MTYAATDIGSRLRQAREQRGLTLQEISLTSKIPVRSLDAIERSDFDRLPGGIFRTAYIRTFAAAVGVDGEELATAYARRAVVEPPVERRRRPTLARWAAAPERMLTTSLGVAALLGFLLARPAQLVDSIDNAPATAVGPSERPSPTTGGNEATVAAETNAPGDRTVRLELQATGPSWIHASADGQPVLSRLLHPGEHALIEARESITLRVGDAGAVDYSLNGDSGRPLGRRGESVTVRVVDGGLLQS